MTIDTSTLRSVPVTEYNPVKEITLKDLAEAHRMSRLSVKKCLSSGGVTPVAKLSTNKVGRPPILFARDEADTAITTARTQKQARSDVDAVVNAAAEALAE